MSGRSFGGRGSRRFGWLYAALAVVVALTASLMAVGPASQTSGSAEAAERAMPRSVVGDDTLGYWTPMGISDDTGFPWLDPGLNQAVYALAKYDGQIYAGGLFDDTGGGGDTVAQCDDSSIYPLQCIAVWSEDDTAWRPVGAGFNNTVDSLVVMDDTLYAGGLFDDTVGGVGDANNECTGDDTPSGDLWTAEIAASDDSWSSVAWGDPEVAPSTSAPTLVAVASGGDDTRVMTSPDGVNWSSPLGPIPVNDWQSVVWGGLFVAVGSRGDDSQVMTSPNGINWTPRLAASDDSWSSVTFRNDNGTFVAVASSGDDTRVMYSNDGAGVSWSSPSSPVPVNAWQSVAWGDDTFVAVASSGDDTRVMYSNDDSGAIWLSPSSPVPVNDWQSVAWGNGTFVAVGSSGDDSQVMTSPNGVTWTPRLAASDDSWSSVTYGNGTFVAVASSGDDSRIMTSRNNGVTWTLRNSPAANAWQSVAWGHDSLWPDTFVAVGSNPPRTSQVMRSAVIWSPDPLGCIAAWKGGNWSPVSGGLNGKAQVMTVLGDDTLLVAGGFARAGTVGPPNSPDLGGLAAWSDGTWTAPGVGGFRTSVNALASDGSSVAYIGGQYEGDGADDSGIMQMTGPFNARSSWFPMSTGFSWLLRDDTIQPGAVDALAILDSTVYAGGYFTATGTRNRLLFNLASWNGTSSSWQTVGPGLNSRNPGSRRPTSVRALAADDTRGLLYVGGTFDDTPGGYGNGQCDDTTIPGGPLRCVTVWDTGINQFIPFKWGSADDSNGLTGEASSFVVDDSVVYVGGNFNTNAQGAFPYQWNLKNVGKWTWGAPSAAVTSSTGTAGSSVPITGSRLICVSEVKFGSTSATFTRSSITQMSATVPNLAPGTYPITVNAVGGIAAAGTYTVTATPTPPSPTPPSPPRDVAATAGDASATITWQAPASTGSYPVTDYEVTSSPGGRTCLVSATTCRITDLTNGTSYTFTARALSGAGWSAASAPSNAVTPRAEPPTSTIVITGTRSAAKATVTGKTTGFGMGGMATAHTRTARGTPYTTGSTALVSTKGTFEWSRGISKRKTLWVYFTGGDAKSNVLVLRP
jgi:hypothetical protein